jgi:hypothetical protein
VPEKDAPETAPDWSLEPLRPLVVQLRTIQRQCRPFGADYDAVAVSLAALDEMAETLTGKPSPFGASGNHR